MKGRPCMPCASWVSTTSPNGSSMGETTKPVCSGRRRTYAMSRRSSDPVIRGAAQPVAGGIMSFGSPICLWCEAPDFGFPMTSLVYPSVYPMIGRLGESKCWRGLRTIFRFRPRPPDCNASAASRLRGVSTIRAVSSLGRLALNEHRIRGDHWREHSGSYAPAMEALPI